MLNGKFHPIILLSTFFLWIFSLEACSPQITTRSTFPKSVGEKEFGKASYYSDRLAGNKTASGEVYDPLKMTAAHRTLPFGTKVSVVRKNGGSVNVRINDRGPWVEGRIIDLSRAAAEKVEMIKAGVVDVSLEILELPKSKTK